MSSSRMLLLAALASAATLAGCDVARPLANDGGGGIHPAGWSDPTSHGYAAEEDIASCTACHGTDYAGGSSGASCNACHATALAGDWKTNCTFCHGTQTANYTSASLAKAAPPEGVQGQTATTDVHVGAHQSHVEAGSIGQAISCDVCHPAVTDALGHFSGGRANVTFSGLANSAGATSTYTSATATCSTYCHGKFSNGANATPTWTGTIASGCTACHGNPPSTDSHGIHSGTSCATCHVETVDAGGNILVSGGKHVNGTNDVIVVDISSGQHVVVPKTTSGSAWNCTFCHNATGN